MKITTITYNRTVNLGNYESKRLEATCEVDDGEDPSVAADELRAWLIAELQKTGPAGNGD
jgi:hypothetical protein